MPKMTGTYSICTRILRNLNSITVQFFEMVPIRRIQWPSGDIAGEDLDVAAQRYMLSMTVNNELCRQYPPSLQYQRAFIKKLLTTLEGYGVEVCDELYETYTDLLQHLDREDETLCYKTYTIDADVKITIQESVNMISFGTTGLSTWQAAQNLAEWAVQNPHLLENKNILELGCGLGLTGLVVCKQCRVNTYTFTDCHTQVLDLLADNIKRNFKDVQKLHFESCCRNHNGSDKSTTDCDTCDKNTTDCDTCDKNTIDCDTCDKNTTDCDTCDKNTIDCGTCDKSTTDCDTCDKNTTDCDTCDKHRIDCVTSGMDKTYCDTNDKNTSNCVKCDMNKPSDNVRSPDCVTSSICDTSNACSSDLIDDERTGVAGCNIKMCPSCKDIRLASLDWENIDHKLMEQVMQTDVILAADVVYDLRIIPALVSVLKIILGNHSAVAYIASTIRNEDTRDQFLITLSSESLKYEQVDPPTRQLFHYDRSVPIEILKITATPP